MGEDAKDGQPEGETVDEAEEKLQDHDGVDEARKEAFGDNGVLFDQFREIIETRGDGQGEEAEAHDGAEIAHERKNPHLVCHCLVLLSCFVCIIGGAWQRWCAVDGVWAYGLGSGMAMLMSMEMEMGLLGGSLAVGGWRFGSFGGG